MKKQKKTRGPQKMSDEYRNKRIEIYSNYWEAYVNGWDNDIYHALQKIAKKKYSVDSKLADFEEQFFQNYMKNGEKYKLYSDKEHEKLVKMRAKANKN